MPDERTIRPAAINGTRQGKRVTHSLEVGSVLGCGAVARSEVTSSTRSSFVWAEAGDPSLDFNRQSQLIRYLCMDVSR